MNIIINPNEHIGAYHFDAAGNVSIIGAADEMNETFNNRIQNNTFSYEDFLSKDTVRLHMESTQITSENYADFRKTTGTMPKHCYGTTYGHAQNEKIKQKLKQYYLEQNVTKDELKDFFKDCCKDMRVILAQERKTTGLNENDNTQIILDTYEMFRMANSVMARLGCDEEGKRVAWENGWKDRQDKDWVYYNADFYYESEELRDLFKEAAQEIADEWECGEVDTSKRDTDYLASYSSSFNEVWQNGSEYGTRICSMLDLSKEPPEDFYLFFREFFVEQEKHTGIVQVGIEGKTDIKKEVVFNIYGIYEQLPQFYHVGELLKDDMNENTDSTFIDFLNNFDIYTRYYGTVQMRE